MLIWCDSLLICPGVSLCVCRYGWGVDFDYSLALRWLRFGAGGQDGDPLAQFEIARMYAK